jgi:hypothetical protein
MSSHSVTKNRMRKKIRGGSGGESKKRGRCKLKSAAWNSLQNNFDVSLHFHAEVDA